MDYYIHKASHVVLRLHYKTRPIEDLRQQVEDTQKDRDHWRQQATHLLEDKRHTETTKPKKRWFW